MTQTAFERFGYTPNEVMVLTGVLEPDEDGAGYRLTERGNLVAQNVLKVAESLGLDPKDGNDLGVVRALVSVSGHPLKSSSQKNLDQFEVKVFCTQMLLARYAFEKAKMS